MDKIKSLKFGSSVTFEGGEYTSMHERQHGVRITFDRGVFTIIGKKKEPICVSITNVRCWVPDLTEAPEAEQTPAASAPAAEPAEEPAQKPEPASRKRGQKA